MPIPVDRWQWFGTSGHLIVGRECRFHLCTLIGKHLVSTVGQWCPRHELGTSDAEEAAWLKANWPGREIGAGRTYETMVFEADLTKRCNQPDCQCGLPSLLTANELDFQGYNLPADAAAGHMALCRKWAEVGEN